MKNFKPGQKVVFKRKAVNNPNVICPKDGEIVTIKGKCETHANCWDVVEYQFTKRGARQSFKEYFLFPLSETKSPFPSLTFKEVVKEQAPLTCLN